jgi:hypothetical protein
MPGSGNELLGAFRPKSTQIYFAAKSGWSLKVTWRKYEKILVCGADRKVRVCA